MNFSDGASDVCYVWHGIALHYARRAPRWLEDLPPLNAMEQVMCAMTGME